MDLSSRVHLLDIFNGYCVIYVGYTSVLVAPPTCLYKSQYSEYTRVRFYKPSDVWVDCPRLQGFYAAYMRLHELLFRVEKIVETLVLMRQLQTSLRGGVRTGLARFLDPTLPAEPSRVISFLLCISCYMPLCRCQSVAKWYAIDSSFCYYAFGIVSRQGLFLDFDEGHLSIPAC